MTQPSKHYLSSRVFKLNVGFLLNEGPAHNQDSEIDFPYVRVTDDLLVQYVRGPLRLSRTKEGILVQARLRVGIEDECYRCLDPLIRDEGVTVEELYAVGSGAHSEFKIGEDAILDLAPLLRDEVLIIQSHGALCKPDCKGLCPVCGANLNQTTCNCQDEDIDPRLEKLKALLNTPR